MEPLKEYSKLKAMSGEERFNYFHSYMSMINDPYVFIKVFKDFIDIFMVLDKDEEAELMTKFELQMHQYNLRKTKEAQKEPPNSTDTAVNEARVIPLFPTNPPARS